MVTETEACPSALQARRLRDSSSSWVWSRRSDEEEEAVRQHSLQRKTREKRQTDGLDIIRPSDLTGAKLAAAATASTRNYKPVALRWPFLLTQMLLLLLAMTAVLVVQRASPDSDDSAVVDGRIASKAVVVVAADQLEAGSISRIKRSVVVVAVESSSAALEFTRRGSSSSIITEKLLRIAPSLSPVGRGSREPANAMTITTTTIPTAGRAVSTTPATATLLVEAKRDDEGGAVLPTLAPPPVGDDDDLGPRLTWPTGALGEDGGVTLTITNPDEPSRGAGNGLLPTGLPVATGHLSPGTLTTVAENSRTLFGTRTTQPVARPSDAFPRPDSTTVVEPDGVSVAALPDETSSRLLSPPRKWPKIVSPITTTLVLQEPPRTSVDTAGFPVSTFTPPPRTLVVQSGVSALTTTAPPDDGDPVAAAAAAVTGTIVVAGPVDGSSATFFVIAATPGAPATGMTTTVVSLIGSGTPITFGTTLPPPSPPVTLAVISGSGSDSALFTAVPTPSAVAVITTVLQVTTINGTPTTLVSAVLTITPTQVAGPFPTTPTSIDTAATSSPSSPPSSPPQGHAIVLPGFTGATYFASAFLPTLLAAALAAPLAAIDGAARQYAPFVALANHRNGAAEVGSRSPLTQHTAALLPPLFQALPLATGALAALGRGLFAPLAAEAVGFKVHGSCSHLNAAGCGIAPGVSPAAAYALVAVLGSAAALVAIVGLLAARMQTGLHAEPWSIAGVAALSLHGEVRRRLLADTDEEPKRHADLEALFAGDRFGLAHFAADTAGDRDMRSGRGTRRRRSSSNSRSSWSDSRSNKHECESNDEPSVRYEYGIVPLGDTEEAVTAGFGPQRRGLSSGRLVEGTPNADADPGPRHMPFPALSYTGRAIFMALLLGLMSLIVYYHLLHQDNAFELFMDSQTFGVRFFFAAVGSAITAFWASFFTSKLPLFPLFLSIVTIEPFVRMARRPQPASRSVLAGRPTNPFSGAWAAVSQRGALQFATALAAMAAELLPMLLANIPFTLSQTYSAYLACTYASLAVLAGMVLVLAASMFVRWPHMPVDPRSIAGTAYYVADSGYLLRDMSGLSTLGSGEAERCVADLERRYFYDRVVSSSGHMRMVVESVGVQNRKYNMQSIAGWNLV